MAGRAIVTINDKQWSINLANTPAELAQGLGGLPDLPTGTGMFFDLGQDQVIQVTTMPMLFPLDIAFLSETLVVTEVYRNIQPGYLVTSTMPARYFLEVNAGEFTGVESGDQALIELLSLEESSVVMPDWASALFSFIGFAVIAGFMVAMIRPIIKEFLGNLGHRSNPGEVKKHYHGPYLTNWQYGGYSYVEEDPKRPERRHIRGMVDYASPEDVIAIAEREKLPYISLAGGFWERIGIRGWGERVSIAEAKNALARAREHISGGRKSSTVQYVWMRQGDVAEYEKFGSPRDAGKEVGEQLTLQTEKLRPLSFRYRSAGVATIEPYFVGNNYVSLFWGGDDAQWIRDLTDDEKMEFESGVKEETPGSMGIGQPTRNDVSVESFAERDRLGIWITDNRTGKVIAEWWDDEARQMFEDGFFKPATFARSGELGGPEFIESVIDYAENMGWLLKNNPGYSPRAGGKIKARSITLQRAEGAIGRDDFSPRTITAKEGKNVWEQADCLLFEWSQTAPRGSGYHKVDFTVKYEDGETYSGRYDLVHWNEEYPSLAKHMRSFVTFHAGKWCPPHMTEEQYRSLLETEPYVTMRPKFEKFLETYEIGESSCFTQELQGKEQTV